jgi:hypothetical protein
MKGVYLRGATGFQGVAIRVMDDYGVLWAVAAGRSDLETGQHLLIIPTFGTFGGIEGISCM